MPAPGSHRSVRAQLTHTVPQAAASSHGRVCRATHPLAIGCRFGHTVSKFKAFAMLPNNRPAARRPASLPRVSAGRIPRLQRYYQGATTSDRSSRRTSFPSFGGTTSAFIFPLPRTVPMYIGTKRPWPKAIAFSGSPLDRSRAWKRPDLPRSWGTPCAYALLYDPGRISVPGHTVC